MARVYSNNRDTFDDAYRGLKYVAASAKKYGNITLTFNSVLMPPYTEERFDKINDFFSNIDFCQRERMCKLHIQVKELFRKATIWSYKKKGMM